MKENKKIFIAAVKSHPDIPDSVKAHAESVCELVKTTFKKTYFEFIDEQIKLCPRGPEWNKVLQSRKDSLTPYCHKNLLRGRISYEGKDFYIRVDPKKESVVHWEEYEKKQPTKRL